MKKIKVLVVCILVICMFLLPGSSVYADDIWAAQDSIFTYQVKGKEIRLSFDIEDYIYTFTDDEGNPKKGFLIEQLARDLGYEVHDPDWSIGIYSRYVNDVRMVTAGFKPDMETRVSTIMYSYRESPELYSQEHNLKVEPYDFSQMNYDSKGFPVNMDMIILCAYCMEYYSVHDSGDCWLDVFGEITPTISPWQDSSETSEWYSAYQYHLNSLIGDHITETDYLENSWYFLYDIDWNGVPELFVYEDRMTTYVYKCENGSVVSCGMLGPDSEFVIYGITGGPGVLVNFGRQGIWNIGLFQLSETGLTLSETYAEGNLQASGDTEYPGSDAVFRTPKHHKLQDGSGLSWNSNPDYDNMAVFQELFESNETEASESDSIW